MLAIHVFNDYASILSQVTFNLFHAENHTSILAAKQNIISRRRSKDSIPGTLSNGTNEDIYNAYLSREQQQRAL